MNVKRYKLFILMETHTHRARERKRGKMRTTSGQKDIFRFRAFQWWWFNSVLAHFVFADCVFVCCVCSVKNRYAIWNFHSVSYGYLSFFFFVSNMRIYVGIVCIYFSCTRWTKLCVHINNVEKSRQRIYRERKKPS